MRKTLILLVVLLVFPLVAFAIPSGEMTFKSTKSEQANQSIIDKGIEAAIDDMSFLIKPIAKGKLEKTNNASKQIVVKMDGDKLTVRHDNRAPVTSAPDGKPFKWTREDGDVFTVTQKATENTITQVYFSDEGNKTMTYKFAPDFKTMTLDVKVDSPKLPAPLRYSITYAQ